MFEGQREELKKALDLATGTGVLSQPKIDKLIADLVDHDNALRQNLPRRPGEGESYLLNRKTAQAGGTGGGWVGDTDEPTGDAGTTKVRVSFPFRTILERGGVTTAMQKMGRSYRDLLADEIADITLVVRDAEEDGLINGDNGADADQIDGIRVQTPAGQIITLDDGGGNGGVLTLEKLDEGVDLNLGRANMLACSKRSRRQINTLLLARQQVVDTREVKGGFRLPAYSDIPIYTTKAISDAQTQGAATNASDLFFVDNAQVFISELEAINMVPLAKTTSQVTKFDIREMLVLVVKNTKWVSSIKGIIPA